MPFSRLLAKRGLTLAVSLFVVLAVSWLFAYEPVTRNVVSVDAWCTWCHLEQEYNPDVRLSFSKPHPLEPGDEHTQTTCIDCHLPTGFWNSTWAYTHYASVTDLFGSFRDRTAERSGAWIPPAAARAYRVRDRLFENDSNTCRVCHVEEEIKPKRKRGERAHKKALDAKQTCIECHDNMVHRYVAQRPDVYARAEISTDEGATATEPDPFASESDSADPFAADPFETDPFETSTSDSFEDPFATDNFDSDAVESTDDPFANDEFNEEF